MCARTISPSPNAQRPPLTTVTGVHWPQTTSRLRRLSKVRRPSFVGQCSFSRTSRAGAPDKVLLARAHLAFAIFVRCAGGTGRGCGISSERSIRAGRLPAAARLRWLAVVQLCRDLTCRKERSRRRRGLLLARASVVLGAKRFLKKGPPLRRNLYTTSVQSSRLLKAEHARGQPRTPFTLTLTLTPSLTLKL